MRWLALLLVVTACEVPLDPIEDSDLYFSLSGYLDASADTQYVRVEPLARTGNPDASPLDAEVSLVRLRDGAVFTLTQEVRMYANAPAHLYWTTADIDLGEQYRLTVRRADGAETATTVEIPADGSYSVEVQSGPFVCPTLVTVTGAEWVADVQARYLVAEAGQAKAYAFPHIESFEREGDGSITASIYAADDMVRMNVNPVTFQPLLSSEVVVAVTTADWPDPFGLTLEDALRTESLGVENGLGFVGGVVTERRPYTPGVLALGGFGNVGPCASPR